MWNLMQNMRRALQETLGRMGWKPSTHRIPVQTGLRVTTGANEDPVSRLAIVVLRAVVNYTGPLQRNHVRILPDRQIVTDAEAAVYLHNLRKPIQCTVSVEDGLLAIACEPLAAEGEWILSGKRDIASQSRGWLGPLEYAAIEASGCNDILFIGRNEHMIVPAEVAERFEQEYVMLNSHTLIGDRPDRFGIDVVATARWYSPSSTQNRTNVHEL